MVKYEMIKSKKTNFIHVDIILKIKERFLFDTGAIKRSKNNTEYLF